MYGPHLIMEGYGAPAECINNIEGMYQILDVFPSKIGMTKIMPPHVQRYLEHGQDEWGISGFVIIAESHIAIHTYPDKGFFVLDIFSCKEFDIDSAIEIAIHHFKPERYDYKVLNRGEDYPKDIDISCKIVKEDRDNFAVSNVVNF